ncbi:hypothetical protein HZB89_00390, partial [archaeon]|nr:hypothetical protein [archaeon]
MEKALIMQFLQKVIDASKERKFVQSIDLSINFKGIDFEKPENRIDASIQLPFPSAKPKKVVVFARDKTFAAGIKDFVDEVITEDRISGLDKKAVKKLASTYDIVLAEGPVMVAVGKYLGQALSPKGKMPSPIPTNIKAVQSTIDRLKKSIKVSNKKGSHLPVVHASVGDEKMPLDQLTENILTVYNAILSSLNNEEQKIKSIY